VSTNTPGTPGQPEYLSSGVPEYVGTGQPEYVGPGAPGSGGAGGRRWAIAAGGVGVLAVLGAGAWGLSWFLSGGEPAASAVPASAIGYVSVDLDPSAAQKIEAIKLLRKFPAIEKDLDLGSRDDLRRWVFEQMQDDGTCTDLDYEQDVAPWVGDRMALAAVPGADKSVLPLLALQVSDRDAARTGAETLAECATDAPEQELTFEDNGTLETQDQSGGFAFAGDYLLVSDSQAHADRLAGQVQQGSLADDADFQQWMGEVGDPGIVTAYVAKDALRVAQEAQQSGPRFGFGDELPGMGPDGIGLLSANFDGMAGVLRFADGAMEAEFVGSTGSGAFGRSNPAVQTLPASTGAALSVGFQDGWAEDWLDRMAQSFGDGRSTDELLAEAEADTGLELPEDLEALLGDGLTFSVDADIDFEEMISSGDFAQLPAGVRIEGDPATITPVVDKLAALAGPDADQLVVRDGDRAVALGLNDGYVGRLLERGDLGDSDTFKRAVPEADRAVAVFYVNFDAGDGWAERLGDALADGDPTVRENLAPFDALGISGWTDGDTSHGLLRLTTD
jgi:hypothetical protein